MKKIALVLFALAFSVNAFAQNHPHSFGYRHPHVYPPNQVFIPPPPVIIYQIPPPPPIVYQQQRYLVKVCGPVYQTVTAYGISYQQDCWTEWRFVYQ